MNLPPIKLAYLETLTDDTGIFQHSKFGTPNRLQGYTTDDNARALIVIAKYGKIKKSSQLDKLTNTYLSFLLHMQRADGRMRNFLGYDRNFIDDEGSEDCAGRTLWATGYVMESKISTEKHLLAKEIFDRAFRWTRSFKSPRAKAFTLLGLSHYQRAYPGDQNVLQNMTTISDELVGYYKNTCSSDWRWFEPYLTYVNGRLPQALFEVYRETKQTKYLTVAKDSLNFLLDVQMIDGEFVPVGSKGWYKKGETRAMYDQQSAEAASMTEAAISAYRATGSTYYKNMARTVFDWFLGKNTQKVHVYESATGSCYDGLTEQGLNLNKGAEAIVCYLSARMELRLIN